MKQQTLPVITLFCACLFFAHAGCQQPEPIWEFHPVAGTIRIGGRPLAGALVTFRPEPSTDDNATPPYSMGTTDSQGNFSLATPAGNFGAIAGMHRVSVRYADVDVEMLTLLQDELRKLQSASAPDKTEIKNVRDLISEIEQTLGDRIPIPVKYSIDSSLTFNVPTGGTDQANFGLDDE